jgi:hypothetical protein
VFVLERYKNSVFKHYFVFLLRLNNRGEILGPSDIEWWLTSSSTAWNEATFHPGSLTAEGIRPNRFLQVTFAVLVDTSHPSIQRQLSDGFRRAETFLTSKKSFCIEVSLFSKPGNIVS